jgi:hypothetical protein
MRASGNLTEVDPGRTIPRIPAYPVTSSGVITFGEPRHFLAQNVHDRQLHVGPFRQIEGDRKGREGTGIYRNMGGLMEIA